MTNSLSDNLDDVDMTDTDSILDYCVHGLDHYRSAISNLLSLMGSTSGGVSTNQVVTDDDSNGSTNTGSTTDTIANYAAINKIHTNWKDMDFWKAGRGK